MTKIEQVIDEPWKALRFAVIDVEGNGQHPPEIVELACALLIDGSPGEVFNWQFQPSKPITPMASRIHGISNVTVANAPTLKSVATQVMDAIGTAVLVAHAAHVERDILARQLAMWHPLAVLDTLRLAKKAWPGLASYKLASLERQVGITAGGKPHTAMRDAEVAREIFLAGVGELERYGSVSVRRLLAACELGARSRDDQLDLGL